MSREKSSGWLSGGIKPIVDITASVTAVVAYLQAIFKLIKTDFPDTVSLLTIVFTSVMVVGWRWGTLNQKKKKTPSNVGSKPPAKGSIFSRLLAPLKTSKNDPYLLPLTRRRMEAGLIIVLVLFTLAWTGFNALRVVEELTEDKLLTCSDANEKGNLLILVADLTEAGSGPPLLIADKIFDALTLDQQEGDYNVCRLAEPIKLSTIAKEKAGEYEAEIVIWGRIDVIYEIHLEAPAFGNPDRILSELSSEEAASVDFQFTEPDHIAYVTQFALSEILLLNGQELEAQTRLAEVLAQARQDSMEVTHPENLADGYFLLGLSYHPNISKFPDQLKSLDAFENAMDLNPNLFDARFNHALILLDLGRTEEALADFTYLIEHETPLKADAYIQRAQLLYETDPEAALRDLDAAIQLDPAEGYFYRGSLRLYQGDYQAAIDDLEQAVAFNPQDVDSYHFLGEAQLLAGEIEAAKETYMRIIPFLDADTRELVIADLEEDAQRSPEIKVPVEEIIRALKAAKLPK